MSSPETPSGYRSAMLPYRRRPRSGRSAADRLGGSAAVLVLATVLAACPPGTAAEHLSSAPRPASAPAAGSEHDTSPRRAAADGAGASDRPPLVGTAAAESPRPPSRVPNRRRDIRQHQPAAATPPAATPVVAADRRMLLPTGTAAPRSATPARPRSTGSIATALGGLAFVLGLFFLVAWLLKRSMPRASRPLPAEAVEVLGRTMLADRQYAHLVRVGNKMVLVAVSAGGAETLTEITDPAEVDRLAGICRQAAAASTTRAFRQVFDQFARAPAAGRFVDQPGPEPSGSRPDQPASREPAHV